MPTYKKFKRLFASAEKSPFYWLCGLELQFEYRIYKYKLAQRKTTSIDKKRIYGIKTRALRECLYDVRREMGRYEASQSKKV